MEGGMTRPLPRFVNAFTAKGRRYYYFRRPGAEAIRLPDFGTAEFEIEYRKALHGETPEIGADRTQSGTLNEATVAYYQSLAFRQLAASTQSMRRSYLERFRETYGNKNIGTMPSAFIAQMVDRMKPHEGRNWFKTVRALMQHAISIGLCKKDPTQGVRLPKIKSGGRHTWTETEIAQYEAHHPIGTKARLALALGLYTSQRRGDVARFGRQHIRGSALVVRQSKTGTPLEIELHQDLRRVLEATPTEHLTFLVTKSGKPYSSSGLSDEFRAWCDGAGLPSRCTFHGLRYAMARRLADQGASTHQIAAVTGHKSLKEIERYTKAADQARLAKEAIKLIPSRG
jgi:integrase